MTSRETPVGRVFRPGTSMAPRSGARAAAIAALFVLLTVAATPGDAGQRRQEAPAEVTESGADTFKFHCASCHGVTGRGDGPVAASLRHRPSNLTTMARRNGGRFPREATLDYILGRGRKIDAHGTHDMPVWGPLFRELNPFDSRVDVRATRLVEYLRSIQVK